MSDAPAFHLLADSLRRAQIGLDAAELHGSLSAALCFDRELDPDRWLSDAVGSPLALHELDADLRQQLNWLFDWTCDRLVQRQLEFQLLLPDDDEDLAQRANALAFWCAGFVAALGTSEAADLARQPADVQEFVHDLVELSRAGYECDGEADASDEAQFLELVEYARLGAMTVFETYQPEDPGQHEA